MWSKLFPTFMYFSIVSVGSALNISGVKFGLHKCLVAIQQRISTESQKTPLTLIANLNPFFGKTAPKTRLNAYNYEAPSTLIAPELTRFRGLVVTRAQLQDIAQNGLNPTLSTQNRNSFGSLPDAIHHANIEMSNRKYKEEEHIMIVVQINPEWTGQLKKDPHQLATTYTSHWIPPQAIQSIMAIDPSSTERFRLVEITNP
ncbi:MAG: hypothetical protein R3A80_08700 [Bdellovibrionota bacterium]